MMQMKNENRFGCGERRTQTRQKEESPTPIDKKGIGHDVASTATDSRDDFEQDKYTTSSEHCQLDNTSGADSFNRFWNSYPIKINKKRSIEKWRRINPDSALIERILKSIEAWKDSHQWRAGYIPNPDTWLDGEKWEDEVPPPPKSANLALQYTQSAISQESWESMLVDLSKEG